MIRSSGKFVDLIYSGKSAVIKVVYGAHKVWELISGCFTKGYWLNNRKWTNDRGWKNN